jgi:anthranilate synthase/aminodeoxychorismate synthase-like glutamine amidotransferase
MWVLIDNYDSFTYILHHYLLQTGNDCKVYRNDELSLEQLTELKPERLIISPGPETPLQAGISMQAIAHFHNKIPILGVCLGHQALGMYFGAKLVHSTPTHGKTADVFHNGHSLFQGIENPFTAMRYHSLALEHFENTGMQAIAHTADGIIMALAHTIYPCIGIQFHPESVGTFNGQKMLNNWAEMDLRKL